MASRRSRRSGSRRSRRPSRNRNGQFTSRRSRRSSSRRSQRIGLKSSLLRRLHAADVGAKPAGDGQTTMRPRGYGSVKLTMGRKGGKGSEFVACATMGAGTKKSAVECSEGRNPRLAVAHALRKLAGKVESRSGGFAALNGTKRRRRKSRR